MKWNGLLFCLFFMLSLPLLAEDEVPATKFYCDAEQIEVTDSMILIRLDQRIFETDALLVDQGGIYFTKDMLRCTYCRRPLNPKNTCECPIDPTFE